MTLKKYLLLLWVPFALSFTLSMTYFNRKSGFDTVIFCQALFATTGHFYITHFLAALFFSIHGTTKWHYWRSAAMAYIPFMLSLWGLFFFYVPSEAGSDSTVWGILICGMLGSAILFATLTVKKVKMDLDAVLALVFIIAIIGTITAALFIWAVVKITAFL